MQYADSSAQNSFLRIFGVLSLPSRVEIAKANWKGEWRLLPGYFLLPYTYPLYVLRFERLIQKKERKAFLQAKE